MLCWAFVFNFINYRISHKFIPIFAFFLLRLLFIVEVLRFRARSRFSFCSFQWRNEFETVMSVGRTSLAEFLGWKKILSEEEQRGLSKLWFRPHAITSARNLVGYDLFEHALLVNFFFNSTGDFSFKNCSYSCIGLSLSQSKNIFNLFLLRNLKSRCMLCLIILIRL